MPAQKDLLAKAKAFTNIDSSIYYTEKSLPGLKPDTTEYINAACYLSELYNKRSMYSKAEKNLLATLPIAAAYHDKNLQGNVYNSLASTYKFKRSMDLSLKYYLSALDIFETQKNNLGLVRIYTNLAEYYRSLGKYDDARSYINKSFEIYRKEKLDNTSLLIKMYNRFAAIENEYNVLDSSMFFSLKCIELSRRIGDKNSEAISLNEIGFSLKNRRQWDTALKCYKRAEELWYSIGSKADAAHAIFNQATLLSHNNFPKRQIIPYYGRIIDMVKKENVDYPLDQVYLGISNCYFFLGDSLPFYRYRLVHYNELLKEINKVNQAEINEIKEKYENEKYKSQINQVSGKLGESEKILASTKRENLVIYTLLLLLVLLLVLIAFLFRRIKQANNILESKNNEKDSLIQEIHHRVKNNLQFVSSLINMQIKSSRNDGEVDSLNDASRRIRSMALVHEMLYNQEETTGIEIKKYINELISSINELVNSNKIPIQFSIDCEEFFFETPRAIALGMITSELISNSIKYAFTHTAQPIISITLKEDGTGNIIFTVKDNGSGLLKSPEKTTEKLGMRLVDIFSRQLKGTYSFENENGLLFKLKFTK